MIDSKLNNLQNKEEIYNLMKPNILKTYSSSEDEGEQ